MKGVLVNNKYYGIKKSNVNYGISRILHEPLHFIALEDNSSVGYQKTGNPPGTDFSYSYDKINWVSWDGTSIALNKDDLIYIKGYNLNGVSSGASDYIYFTMSGKIKAQGDVNSLLNIDYSPTEQLPINCYYYLFRNCTSLVYPPSLPSFNLSAQCYRTMFYGCTSLVQAPELSATTLELGCYSYMFYGCKSLVQVSKLPATIAVKNCYYNMFYGCTSLVQAPELSATTLNQDCYYNMFSGCTSLNYIKIAFTGSFSTNYFSTWVRNVSSTGNFYYNGSDTTRGTSAIPTNWTVHTF